MLTFNPGAEEAEAAGSLRVQGQLGLYKRVPGLARATQ